MARIGNIDYTPRERKFHVKRGGSTFKVTIDGIDGKEWTGESEQEAILKAKKEVDSLERDRAETKVPQWIKEMNEYQDNRSDSAKENE